jgi:hypothetical protein
MRTLLSNKKRQQIKADLMQCGYNVNNAYQLSASRENLFGYCYFGFSASKYERYKMRQIWKYLMYISLNNPNLLEWQRQNIYKYLNIESGAYNEK